MISHFNIVNTRFLKSSVLIKNRKIMGKAEKTSKNKSRVSITNK